MISVGVCCYVSYMSAIVPDNDEDSRNLKQDTGRKQGFEKRHASKFRVK